MLAPIARDIAAAVASGAEICLVVGAGNIYRGLMAAEGGMDRARADYMGMLATVMNALALQTALERQGAAVRVLSAIPMPTVCESYIRDKALDHLAKGRVVIFAGGTGNPFFTTDTAAALRAAEMGCDALLKATQVDGVYSADPETTPNARRYDRLSYDEVLKQDLRIMDGAAIALARDNRIPIIVFSIKSQGGLAEVLQGKGSSTTIDGGKGASRKRKPCRSLLGGTRRSREGDMASFELKEIERRMRGALGVLKQEFGGLRTGRANASLLDPITVMAYGNPMPLNQLATVNVPESRLITVQVWDRSQVGAVERAIRESDLGLNPVVDGQLLRLPIPELNEERRHEIAKVAHKYAEQARIAVRNVRRDGMEHLKRAEKDHEMGKDEHHTIVHQGAGTDRQDHQGNRRGPCQQGSRDHAGLIGQRPTTCPCP